jgi:hypothetical protein
MLRSSASMMIRSQGLAFAKSYYAKSLQDLAAPPNGVNLKPVENFKNPEVPPDQQAMFRDFTNLIDHMTNDLLSKGLDPLDIGYAYFKLAIGVATKTDGYYAAGLMVACARAGPSRCCRQIVRRGVAAGTRPRRNRQRRASWPAATCGKRSRSRSVQRRSTIGGRDV